MIDWQPIETAPKDGDNILVYADIWVADEYDMWRDQGFDSKEDLIGWWSYTRGSVSQEKLDEYRTPTHWAPYNSPVTP